MIDKNTNAIVKDIVINADNIQGKETASNRLYVRDAETNALIPVVAEYTEGGEYEVTSNRLYLRDDETNALIPVTSITGTQSGGEAGWRAVMEYCEKAFESADVPDKVYIIPISAEFPTLNMALVRPGSNATTYLTSDGASIPVGNYIHTWDASQDIALPNGDKLRWIIGIQSGTGAQSFVFTNVNYKCMMGIYIGGHYGASISAFTVTNASSLFEFVKFSGSIPFSYIPTNLTLTGSRVKGVFWGNGDGDNDSVSFPVASISTFSASAIEEIGIPLKLSGVNMFTGCPDLRKITLAKDIGSLPTGVIYNSAGSLPPLSEIRVFPDTVFTGNVIIYDVSKYMNATLTAKSMINILNNLGQAGSAVTIALGALLFSNLQAAPGGVEAINNANAKGYTITG